MIPENIQAIFDENGNVLKEYWKEVYPLSKWVEHMNMVQTGSPIDFIMKRDYMGSYGSEYPVYVTT